MVKKKKKKPGCSAGFVCSMEMFAEQCLFAVWKCLTDVISGILLTERDVSVYHLRSNMCTLTSLGSDSRSLTPCVSSAFQILEQINAKRNLPH